MAVNVQIDITANSLDEARMVLEDIATDVERGEFSACSTADQRERFGGSVFVTEED